MARMSIDDMLGRDPRLLRLAKACGWSRRETAGALVLDVWPLCYDRECVELDDVDIDVAADLDGFAQLMVESGLATRTQPGKVRVSGSEERIRYLQAKRSAGQMGGLESGRSRKQTGSKVEAEAKQPSSTGRAPGNPPDLVPDPPPDLPPSLDPVVAKPAAPATRRGFRLPVDWSPRAEERQTALERGLDCADEVAHFRDHHTSKGTAMQDWDAAFRSWLRNAVKWGRGKQTKTQTGFDAVMRIAKGEPE